MALRPSANDSEFISAIRITMIVGLVIHHMFAIPNSGYFPRHSLSSDLLSVANVINGLLHWSTMAAVPLLSILSGYLYFSRPQVQHRSLLSKRVKSILLPSLAWTTLWFVIGYSVAMAGRPFGLLQWLAYDAENPSWLTPLNAIIGITKHPLAFQFWFIHDLMLTLLLAPVIGWLLDRVCLWLILALTAAWLFNAIPFPFFSGNVLYFFCLGAFLAVRAVHLAELAQAAQRWRWLALGLFVLLLLARLISDLHPAFRSYAWLCFLRLAGVATVGLFISAQLQRSASWLHGFSRLSPYAFFIFATHYPLIEFLKVISERIPMQDSHMGQLLTLFVVPAATVVICIAAAKIMDRYTPRLFAFSNGGRDLRPKENPTEADALHTS